MALISDLVNTHSTVEHQPRQADGQGSGPNIDSREEIGRRVTTLGRWATRIGKRMITGRLDIEAYPFVDWVPSGWNVTRFRLASRS